MLIIIYRSRFAFYILTFRFCFASVSIHQNCTKQNSEKYQYGNNRFFHCNRFEIEYSDCAQSRQIFFLPVRNIFRWILPGHDLKWVRNRSNKTKPQRCTNAWYRNGLRVCSIWILQNSLHCSLHNPGS